MKNKVLLQSRQLQDRRNAGRRVCSALLLSIRLQQYKLYLYQKASLTALMFICTLTCALRQAINLGVFTTHTFQSSEFNYGQSASNKGEGLQTALYAHSQNSFPISIGQCGVKSRIHFQNDFYCNNAGSYQ